jgi:hypothetical protein
MLGALLLITIGQSTLSAHGVDEIPLPGQVDISIPYIIVGGMVNDVWHVPDGNGSIASFGYHTVSALYNTAGPGLNSSIEVGILPWVSIGTQISFPQILIYYLQDGSDFLNVSFFATLQFVRTEFVGLQFRAEAQLAPLIGTASN